MGSHVDAVVMLAHRAIPGRYRVVASRLPWGTEQPTEPHSHLRRRALVEMVRNYHACWSDAAGARGAPRRALIDLVSRASKSSIVYGATGSHGADASKVPTTIASVSPSRAPANGENGTQNVISSVEAAAIEFADLDVAILSLGARDATVVEGRLAINNSGSGASQQPRSLLREVLQRSDGQRWDLLVVEEVGSAEFSEVDWRWLSELVRDRIVLLNTMELGECAMTPVAQWSVNSRAASTTAAPGRLLSTSSVVGFLRGSDEWEEEFGFAHDIGLISLRRIASSHRRLVPSPLLNLRSTTDEAAPPPSYWPLPFKMGSTTRRAQELGSPNNNENDPFNVKRDRRAITDVLRREQPRAMEKVKSAVANSADAQVDVSMLALLTTARIPISATLSLVSSFFDMSTQMNIFGCSPALALRMMRVKRIFMFSVGDASIAMFVPSREDADACRFPLRPGMGVVDAIVFPRELSVAPSADVSIVLSSFLNEFPSFCVEHANASTVVIIGSNHIELRPAADNRGAHRTGGANNSACPATSWGERLSLRLFRMDSILYSGLGLMVLRRRRPSDRMDARGLYGDYRRRMHRALPLASRDYHRIVEAAMASTNKATILNHQSGASNMVMSRQDWAEYRRRAKIDRAASDRLTSRELVRINAQEPCTEHVLAKVVRMSDKDRGGSPTSPFGHGSNVSVLCVVYTIPQRAQRVVSQYAAWGHRCTLFAVFTSRDDAAFSPLLRRSQRSRLVVLQVPGGDAYDNIWRKMVAIRSHIERSPQLRNPLGEDSKGSHGFDYYVFGGDDYYFSVENFRYHATLGDPSLKASLARDEPRYLGYVIQDLGALLNTFAQGGCYVLNRAAFGVALGHRNCEQHRVAAEEDQLLSLCLGNANVSAEHTVDEFGEPLFNMISPWRLQTVEMTHGPHQRDQHRVFRRPASHAPLKGVSWRMGNGEADISHAVWVPPPLRGLAAVSYRTISFHYVEADRMKEIDAAFSGHGAGV